MRAVYAVFIALFTLAVVVPVCLFIATRPSHAVLASYPAPQDARDAGSCVLVLEGSMDWDGFPFHVSARHSLYIGRECGSPSYGHVKEYSLHPEPTLLEEHLRKSRAEWSDDGVTFIEASGHRLFIPGAMYRGGR